MQLTRKRDRGEGRRRYREYLNSSHWRAFRARIIAERKACQRCGHAYRLQVHHLHYHNRGEEKPEDVELLCRDCHEQIHWPKSRLRKIMDECPPGRRKRDEYFELRDRFALLMEKE